MTLLVDELYPGVVFEQNFRIKKTVSMPHFRPWIYKQGTIQDGELTLEILQDGELLKTATIDYAKINEEITGTYAHGQIRFDLDPMQLNHDRKEEWTNYTVRLYMDNHTKDTANFIGAVRRYELKVYDTYGDGVVNNEAPNDMIEPLGFEIYRWRY
jgi:hypothetical protein